MGHCCSKNVSVNNEATSTVNQSQPRPVPASATPSVETNSYAVSPFASPLPAGVAPSPSPARTPGRKFRWPLPPPSPAKPIMAAIMRRKGSNQAAPMEGTIPEDGEGAVLDKNFGYGKNLGAKFELGKEVGRGHFGHTCWAKGKKGEVKGKSVAVKIISKAKMTSAISVEDVRREVKILKALSGHKNMIKFHDAFEDANNVYIVMELCEGGELLDRILSRGGRYTEGDAKNIIVQILSVVAFCHLQGVVHRDLKPENFLFTTRDEDAPMKIIDFGLSDFIRPDQRLNDIVGSAYYVAPEVLHRSYSVEADMWSIGVITYILLCGSRPFWARTESGIFRSVLRADPNFDDSPWPSVSLEAKDFVKRLLNKDHRKRMTAAQALAHPWLQDNNRVVPLDILIYKLVKSYIRATPFRRAAQKALMKSRTDAMQESRVFDIINVMEPLYYKKMDFEEFCAAAISTYQLEASEEWESIASTAFEYFEQDGNKVISVEELALELNLGPSAHSLLKDWIRVSDGKLSFLGYTKFLHGVTIRASNIRRR
ncbi:CDPK-related kinase 4-like isoform X2 [Gossypium arboreum]|uniref:CDPK-related kinase 4-like isoform X2 n=1 Tax=Gossypium arboreum TaxID=29729 RepID=UPI0022F1D6F6|nr:CDPK-related kinase 4-like isoform X2 [Gossypium arboreum]